MTRHTTPPRPVNPGAARAAWGPVLGLDCSSTVIGYAIHDDARLVGRGFVNLSGDIAHRCLHARAYVRSLLATYAPALVIIESPVSRFAKAALPQARVSGAALCALAECDALWHEATPSEGKAALCGDGAATKQEMIAEAARRLGMPPVAGYREVGRVVTGQGRTAQRTSTLWGFSAAGVALVSEDEADAYGLALAGLSVRVERKEAA